MSDVEQFIQRARQLIDDLQSTEIPPEVARNRDYVLGKLRKMVEEAETSTLPLPSARVPHLTRLVVDQWPLGDHLSNEVGAVEGLYRKL